MTPIEIGATVASALLSTHSAFYLPKTYAKVKLFFSTVQTVRSGLRMDTTTLDELFAAVKNAQNQSTQDDSAKAAAIAKADQSVQAYKAARSAFFTAVTTAFPE